MRLLFDESVPKRLARDLVGHDVKRVQEVGWAGIGHGKLLSLAAASYDALITADRNIEFQQNLSKLPVAVVILLARSNRYGDLAPLVPELLPALGQLGPRTLVRVGRRL